MILLFHHSDGASLSRGCHLPLHYHRAFLLGVLVRLPRSCIRTSCSGDGEPRGGSNLHVAEKTAPEPYCCQILLGYHERSGDVRWQEWTARWESRNPPAIPEAAIPGTHANNSRRHQNTAQQGLHLAINASNHHQTRLMVSFPASGRREVHLGELLEGLGEFGVQHSSTHRRSTLRGWHQQAAGQALVSAFCQLDVSQEDTTPVPSVRLRHSLSDSLRNA